MITWKQLCQRVLTATATDIYTAPKLTRTAIHQVSAWNKGSSPVAVMVYVTPPNGIPNDDTAVWCQNIPAGSSAQIPQLIGHKLEPGFALWATGAGVTLTISGAEGVV